MYLSYDKIEQIADTVISDFRDKFPEYADTSQFRMPNPTAIDQFAEEYLGLDIKFAHLSSDGNFCGLTAYEDFEFTYEVDGEKRTLPLKKNQVVLDDDFVKPKRLHELCGKRRFTLAHECAHQIIFRLESADGKVACRKKYAARICCPRRNLKSPGDWSEWQANALAAAILMPHEEISLAIFRHSITNKLKDYEGYYTNKDLRTIRIISDCFGVSLTTAKIRLKQLGYTESRPFDEFYEDPWRYES